MFSRKNIWNRFCGNVGFEIRDPITKGETFDLSRFKDRDPVVITETTGKCLVNCTGTESFHTSNAVPTWNLVIKSPIKYSIRMFDNLGQFVSTSEGELNTSAWASLAKTGDSAAIHLKILPVSKQGQQIGTGAYIMMATITALGDQVKTGSTGESIIVKNAKRDYLKRFGYMRK